MSRASILLPFGLMVGLIFLIPTIPDYNDVFISGITIFVVALFLIIMNMIMKNT